MNKEELLESYKRIHTFLDYLKTNIKISIRYMGDERFEISLNLGSLKGYESKLREISVGEFLNEIKSKDFWERLSRSKPFRIITGLPVLFQIPSELTEHPDIDIKTKEMVNEINRKIRERFEDPLAVKINRNAWKIGKIVNDIYEEPLVEYFLEHE
jgi:hypothetical protein